LLSDERERAAPFVALALTVPHSHRLPSNHTGSHNHPGLERCRGALNAFTHRPNVASLMPSSRATEATARPVLITSLTASSLYSGVNSRRCPPTMNTVAYKVSTKRDEGHPSG